MNKYLKCLAALWATAIMVTTETDANANEYFMNGGNCNEPVCCDATCPSDYRVEVDFLWWDLRRCHPSFSVSQAELIKNGVIIRTHHKFPKTDFHPGVRFGFYFDNLCQCFDFGVIWTHYEANDSFGSKVGPEAENSVLDGLEKICKSLETTMNCLDFDFSRNLTCNSCFTVRPHIGIRTLWVTDKSKTRGRGTDVEDPSMSLRFRARAKDSYCGVGVEGGLWAEWKLMCGLSLVGHFGGSVLRSADDFHYVSVLEKTYGGDFVDDTTKIAASGSVPCSNQTFDYYIGLQYAFDYCGMDFLVKAGWEHFSTNLERFDFEGLTTGVEFKF